MIKGIGTDIVAIGRIREMIRHYGDHFLHKIFTDAEMEYCGGKADPAIHFAGRWAAKEAFYKALPTSCQRLATWKSIQILAAGENGRPVIEICSDRLRSQVAAEEVSSLLVSISHEKEYCLGFVAVA
jgi:holo-[acyl-carrier protein] synthase